MNRKEAEHLSDAIEEWDLPYVTTWITPSPMAGPDAYSVMVTFSLDPQGTWQGDYRRSRYGELEFRTVTELHPSAVKLIHWKVHGVPKIRSYITKDKASLYRKLPAIEATFRAAMTKEGPPRRVPKPPPLPRRRVPKPLPLPRRPKTATQAGPKPGRSKRTLPSASSQTPTPALSVVTRTIHFYECEHSGDLRHYEDDVRAAGGEVVSSNVDEDHETCTITVRIRDMADFVRRFKETDAGGFVDGVSNF